MRDAGQNLTVESTVTFPVGADGDKAREALPRSVQQSHERLAPSAEPSNL